mgnify:CR=1 FL=1
MRGWGSGLGAWSSERQSEKVCVSEGGNKGASETQGGSKRERESEEDRRETDR